MLSHDLTKAFILFIIVPLSSFQKVIEIFQICIFEFKFSNKFLHILFALTLGHFCNPGLLLSLTTPPLRNLTLPNTPTTTNLLLPGLNLGLQLPNPIIKLLN